MMSVRGHREQELQSLEAGNPDGDEEEENECLRQFSRCPACKQECDMVLILPCSHTMCRPCVEAGERVRSGQRHGVSLPVCSVLCPGCKHPVELPCWTRSTAASCLPKHPTLSPACVGTGTRTREGACGDQHQHVQVSELQ